MLFKQEEASEKWRKTVVVPVSTITLPIYHLVAVKGSCCEWYESGYSKDQCYKKHHLP